MYGYLGTLGVGAVAAVLVHFYISSNLRQRNNELSNQLEVANDANRLMAEKNEKVFHHVAHTLAENESAMRAWAIGNGYYGEQFTNPSYFQQQPVPEQAPMQYSHSYTLRTSTPRTIYHTCDNPDCQWDCRHDVYHTLMAAFAEEDREKAQYSQEQQQEAYVVGYDNAAPTQPPYYPPPQENWWEQSAPVEDAEWVQAPSQKTASGKGNTGNKFADMMTALEAC